MSKVHNIINVSLGNFFEMYDFMVFGLFAQYIAITFFPSNNSYISLMLSFTVFGVGFLMRPLGAVILGSFTDKYGRKNGLLLTISGMGLGTLTIAITPGYESIGILAPIIVLIGRMIQGFSAGAELGGVSVYLSEIASNHNRGFIVSFQSASQQLTIAFAAVLGFILTNYFDLSFMHEFGWRIPFIIGCLIIPVIIWQRINLDESAEFISNRPHQSLVQIIFASIENIRFLFICSLMVMLTTVAFYMITVYTPTFASKELHFTDSQAFILTLIIALSNFLLLPIMGMLSDKIGRIPQLLIFSILFIFTAYPVMSWITHYPHFIKVLFGELWLSLLYSGYNGAMVARLTEIVPHKLKTVSFSLSYSISAAIYGGFTPAIATQLIHISGNKASPGIWLTIAALGSLLAIKFLYNTNKDMCDKYDQ